MVQNGQKRLLFQSLFVLICLPRDRPKLSLQKIDDHQLVVQWRIQILGEGILMKDTRHMWCQS